MLRSQEYSNYQEPLIRMDKLEILKLETIRYILEVAYLVTGLD